MQKNYISIPFTVLTVILCVCFITDSFMEMKLTTIANIPLTAGFLIFPITYIVNDCITELYGFKKAMFVTVLTFTVHLCVVLLLQLACLLPPTGTWEGEEHFQFIFGLAPRITIASILGFICGSTANAFTMDLMKHSYDGKRFKLRAFLSTCAGEPIDAFVFFTVAFTGLVPFSEVMAMACVQAIGKIIYEACVLPITHCVVRKIKAVENVE